jgi:hypothetical protein
MTIYEKLELWAENTNDINNLRNAFIEVISNNKVNLDGLYNDHKKSIEREVTKDQHI